MVEHGGYNCEKSESRVLLAQSEYFLKVRDFLKMIHPYCRRDVQIGIKRYLLKRRLYDVGLEIELNLINLIVINILLNLYRRLSKLLPGDEFSLSYPQSILTVRELLQDLDGDSD